MKKVKNTYAYGMFILGTFCMLAGFATLKLQGFGPMGLGNLILGLFMIIQYLKSSGKTPPHIIRLLTWLVVAGFLVVDVMLIFVFLKK